MENEISVYGFSDYKDFLRAKISKSSTSWGLVTKLASAAQCQRSYLSRVLGADIHLTPDHAYGLCKYWELNPKETEYFITLLEKERASTIEYRRHLEGKIKDLRREQENLANRVNRPRADDQNTTDMSYYTAWFWSAIHILVSIPQYQTVEAISARLHLSPEIVRSVLLSLERLHYVSQRNNRWWFNASEIHLPWNSPLVSLHHGNWRQRAVINSQDPTTDGLHYTVVQSISKKAFAEIKQKMLEFIDELTKIAGPSKEEELIALTCDFFRVN